MLLSVPCFFSFPSNDQFLPFAYWGAHLTSLIFPLRSVRRWQKSSNFKPGIFTPRDLPPPAPFTRPAFITRANPENGRCALFGRREIRFSSSFVRSSVVSAFCLWSWFADDRCSLLTHGMAVEFWTNRSSTCLIMLINEKFPLSCLVSSIQLFL